MQKKFPHFCIEQAISPEDNEFLYHVALKKNRANISRLEAGADFGKLWSPGETLRVSFLDGDPVVQSKVASYAIQWCQYANIRFAFVQDPDAEIRISFADVGTWSRLGLEATRVARDKPTMNFDDLEPDTSEAVYSHYVLHEFGHALGLLHEHQSPKGGIQWDRQAVIRELSEYWNESTIERNIFGRFNGTETQFSHFDPKSIMIYEIPGHWTLNGLAFSRNYVLSQTDKDFIRTCYPAN